MHPQREWKWVDWDDEWGQFDVVLLKLEETVDGMIFPYVRPQDNGNRTDTRWFAVTDERGQGLRIAMAEMPLSFSTWPYTLEDLQQADHDYELPRRPFNTIFVDHKLHGVGGDNSWGYHTHEIYKLNHNDYCYSFHICSFPRKRLQSGKGYAYGKLPPKQAAAYTFWVPFT